MNEEILYVFLNEEFWRRGFNPAFAGLKSCLLMEQMSNEQPNVRTDNKA